MYLVQNVLQDTWIVYVTLFCKISQVHPHPQKRTASYVAAGSSVGGGGWSDHVSSIQSSLQIPSQKKKSAWAASNSKAASKIGRSVIAAASEQPKIGTATKYMAKERAQEKKMNRIQSEAQQGGTGKKKESKAKQNELKDLAFGRY